VGGVRIGRRPVPADDLDLGNQLALALQSHRPGAGQARGR
jgi:hypothetical protein